ncbi:MAG: type I DNA topoisomerase [Chloroflexi bacterium]|nr:type I DNA topoisomerase [Chloroflexota bacterium]
MATRPNRPKTSKRTTRRRDTSAAPSSASPGNGRHLVVVESPAKATTVGRILGSAYTVKASMGHVRDLPEGKLGVDTDQEFLPDYQVMKDKRSIIADLKKAGAAADDVYLATDPDREGEAISWHLLEAAGWKNKPVKRVVFHSITPEAIKEAFEHDREIDMRLVNAQQARRILDRLVGYQLSPLLWRKVRRGLSAGRVQSVALRLVVDRDSAISAFTPVEYWTLAASLEPDGGRAFEAKLHNVAGEAGAIELPDQSAVDRVAADLKGAGYKVASVKKREIKRRPAPPFITSTLQQDAFRQLRMSARQTMSVAQQLYEGINVGEGGSVGLITYMRTDSPQVADSAIDETRSYVTSRWGSEYVPQARRRYTTRSKVAQEAHEAIRPTSSARSPESLRGHLTNDQARLYDLIWKRMVASQMADAVLDSTQIEITANGTSGASYLFRVSGSVLRFAGFRVLYLEAKDEDAEDDDEAERVLPALTEDQVLAFLGLDPQQHFTQPPPHYTEASLIKALEERGIGRPSTYAPTVSVIVDRQYVTRERGTLKSTRLGQVVCEQLTGHFPDIMDLDFTAQLEQQLDDVANGKKEWVPLLKEFYGPFKEQLDRAMEEMPRVKVEEPTDEICEVCGRPMVIKHGKFGQFLSCTGFPDCKNSRPLLKKTGAKCPRDGGDLVERRARGRIFYGCSNYPECDFTVSRRPLPAACPECEGLLVAAGRNRAQCTNCAYRGPVPEEEPQAAGAA